MASSPNISAGPVLLIGGFNDQCATCRGSVAGYAVRLAEANPGLPVQYLSWNQAIARTGQAWFDGLRKNAGATLVGQSLGGWVAARLAVSNTGSIEALITIDPVSPMFVRPRDATFARIANSVGTWIDATQVPGGVRFLGRRWGKGPAGHAARFVETPYNHADFPYTMDHLYKGGYLPDGLNWTVKLPY